MLEFECEDASIDRKEGHCLVADGYKFYLLYCEGVFWKHFYLVKGLNNIEEFNQMKEKLDIKVDYFLVTCENEVIWFYASNCEMEFYPLGRSIMNRYSNIEESAEVVNQKEEAAGEEAEVTVEFDGFEIFSEIEKDIDKIFFTLNKIENYVNYDLIFDCMNVIRKQLYRDLVDKQQAKESFDIAESEEREHAHAQAMNQQEEAAGEEAEATVKFDDSRTFIEIVRDLEILLFRIGNMENSVNNNALREHMLSIEYQLFKDYFCSMRAS